MPEQSESIEGFGRKLERQIWITKGARFNAHRRLIRQNEWSLRAISSLSVYLTIASVAIAIPAFGISNAAQAKVTILLAALSLTLLVFSLLEANRNNLVRAERLHRCGMELSRILHDLQVILATSVTPDADAISVVADEYGKALEQCCENHDPVDFDTLRADNRTDFALGRVGAQFTRVSIWARLHGAYLLAIVVPPVLVGIWIVRTAAP